MNYKLIDRVPTSKYGTTLVKRCKWCYNTITFSTKQTLKGNEDNYVEPNKKNLQQKFCCKDCEEEYYDYNYLQRYKKQKEKYRKGGIKIYKDRKEYYIKYRLKNKEIINNRVKIAMRRYRARKKVALLKQNYSNDN